MSTPSEPDQRATNAQPQPKFSFEANEDVRRWLKEQALDEGGATKPKWQPTFLAAQRDAPWILSALERFYEEDLITDIVSVVKSGKEATVYCCAAHPALGVEYVAAKVYRPRMFRSLKNDAVYRMSRIQRDADGREARGERYLRSARKSAKGRDAQVSWWIDYEYETQRILYDAGADVPRPLAHIGNSILMEYIGDADGAAPLLREVEMTTDEARPLFDRVMRNIELALARDRIHGDLSAYNLLYWQGTVTIIDFAQAVDPRYNLDVYPFLARDIQRVCHYFARFGVQEDPAALAGDLWDRYLTGDL
ncbi:MAG TPA: RIO1 family regulatory kinase/ATPase [Ktedonobacterales bacterium]|nr:RIO1 family regulatory kinase/ATPase [Ktedonobacterales bacterium]